MFGTGNSSHTVTLPPCLAKPLPEHTPGVWELTVSALWSQNYFLVIKKLVINLLINLLTTLVLNLLISLLTMGPELAISCSPATSFGQALLSSQEPWLLRKPTLPVPCFMGNSKRQDPHFLGWYLLTYSELSSQNRLIWWGGGVRKP